MFLPSSILFIILPLLLQVGPSLSSRSHVIEVPSSSVVHPSSLAWDPTGQHFLVGSRRQPSISSVSDAGVVETLISASGSSSSHITSVTVDDSRRRLIAAVSSPSSIAAFDLRSSRPYRQIFSSPLPDPETLVSGLSVDPASGKIFIVASDTILVSDREGNISVLSKSPILGTLAGAAQVNGRGFLLAVGRDSGKLFKVDADDGTAREVILSGKPSPEMESVAVRSDGTAILAGNSTARWMKSNDAWGETGVYDEARVGDGEVIRGVAVREGKRAYVLVTSSSEEGGGWRVEEVEWERERGEDDMVWGMVLLGLGLAYFMYWRFQMKQLVTNVNKKRN